MDMFQYPNKNQMGGKRNLRDVRRLLRLYERMKRDLRFAELPIGFLLQYMDFKPREACVSNTRAQSDHRSANTLNA